MSQEPWNETSPDLFTEKPLTPESFACVWADMIRPKAEIKLVLPREQQIIAAFGGESIFPPYLHEVMMHHGVYEDAPEWTPEEFAVLWKDLQAAMVTNRQGRT